MTELALPEGRHVTNRQMAEFVASVVGTAEKRIKGENRWLFGSLVAVYQFHIDLAAVGGVAAAYVGWTRFLPHAMPHINRLLGR